MNRQQNDEIVLLLDGSVAVSGNEVVDVMGRRDVNHRNEIRWYEFQMGGDYSVELTLCVREVRKLDFEQVARGN
jgi:hypothetical protein